MSNISQSKYRYKRLRDFGAFQTDVSVVDTLNTGTVEPQTKPAILPHSFASTTGATIPFQNSPWQTDTQRGTFGDRAQQILKHKWFALAVRLSMTLFLFVCLFKSISWSMVLPVLVHIHPGSLLIGITMGGSAIVLSAYQWWGLLRMEQIRFDLADLIKLYLVGITFNHFLPTGMGGDTFKTFYVGHTSRSSVGATGATIMCRVTGFVGMVLLVIPVLLALHTQLPFTLIPEFIVLCLLISAMIFVAFLFTFLLPFLVRNKKVQHRLLALLAGIKSTSQKCIATPRPLVAAIVCGMLFWLIAILNCYVYANALGVQVSLDFYILAVPLIAIVTSLPISINGFGVREGAFAYVFSFVHVAPTTALLLAFLLDLQAFCFAIIGCGIYWTLAGKTRLASHLDKPLAEAFH